MGLAGMWGGGGALKRAKSKSCPQTLFPGLLFLVILRTFRDQREPRGKSTQSQCSKATRGHKSAGSKKRGNPHGAGVMVKPLEGLVGAAAQ